MITDKMYSSGIQITLGILKKYFEKKYSMNYLIESPALKQLFSPIVFMNS